MRAAATRTGHWRGGHAPPAMHPRTAAVRRAPAAGTRVAARRAVPPLLPFSPIGRRARPRDRHPTPPAGSGASAPPPRPPVAAVAPRPLRLGLRPPAADGGRPPRGRPPAGVPHGGCRRWSGRRGGGGGDRRRRRHPQPRRRSPTSAGAARRAPRGGRAAHPPCAASPTPAGVRAAPPLDDAATAVGRPGLGRPPASRQHRCAMDTPSGAPPPAGRPWVPYEHYGAATRPRVTARVAAFRAGSKRDSPLPAVHPLGVTLGEAAVGVGVAAATAVAAVLVKDDREGSGLGRPHCRAVRVRARDAARPPRDAGVLGCPTSAPSAGTFPWSPPRWWPRAWRPLGEAARPRGRRMRCTRRGWRCSC